MKAHTMGPWVAHHQPTPVTADYDWSLQDENMAFAMFSFHPEVTPGEQRDIAAMMAAAPEMSEAAKGYDALIKRAQEILARFLTPDGDDANTACGELLGLLDGPPWREAQQKYAAAIVKAEGG